ncbi:hypothetical protein Sjap_018771 [Stephania japonica]|uniref:Cytochrome P450 n=1 Tax=Stephania japonica TaxID=461633 RepID=A0AAP0NNK4_9MAGN
MALPLFLLPLIALILLMIKRKNNNDILPPGPPKLPIIGNLHQLGALPHRSLSELSKQHGPVMLLQLGRVPTLVISSPDAAREVLKTLDHEFCSRPALHGPKLLSYNFLDIANAPYGAYWRDVKKVCVSEVFSTKRVQASGKTRADEVANMIKSFTSSASSSSGVNLTKELLSLTYRSICRLAFGESYDIDIRFEESVCEAMALLGAFAGSDFFPNYCVGGVLDVLTGLNARLEKCFRGFDELFQKVINERMTSPRRPSKVEDITDVLLRMKKDQIRSGGGAFTDENIKAIFMDLFVGGMGAPAVTAAWAMTELMRKPETMKKLQQQIRNKMGNKGKVEEADLDQLQYLKFVIKETLRLHPPEALLVPRESINHCKINGYDIRPKTRVLVNAWAIGRNPESWNDPEKFSPERFEYSSVDYKGQHYEYVPFGAGRRICPGIGLGVAMVELALANLLYCFNWELPSEMKEEAISMDETAGIIVHKKHDLRLVPVKYVPE